MATAQHPAMTNDVREFCARIRKIKLPARPAWPDRAVRAQRLRLMQEEMLEYIRAVDSMNPERTLDGLVDLAYVVIGTAAEYGFDFDEAWRRVHAANMKKEHGSSGRMPNDAVKPPDWKAPDLSDLVGEMAGA